MKKKLDFPKKSISKINEKILTTFILLTIAVGDLHASGTALEQRESVNKSFNPLDMIYNLTEMLRSVEELLGVLFGFLGFLVTGFGLYTAIQVLRGAQSAQRLENPWAYVIGAVIIGPLLMFAAFMMTGMWDALVFNGNDTPPSNYL